MLWIAENAKPGRVIRSGLAALQTRGARPPTNQQLARPPEGFGELYAPAVAALEERGARFLARSEASSAWQRTSTGFAVDVGGQVVSSTRLVSTIPVDHIRELCGLSPDQHLPTVTLITLFFSFAGRRGFDDPILYNFSHEGAWKRLTMYSDFYGLRHDREYFAVEVISGARIATAEQAVYDFRRHVVDNGLFLGDLVAEGHHVLHQRLPHLLGRGGRASRRCDRPTAGAGASSPSVGRERSSTSRPHAYPRSTPRKRSPPAPQPISARARRPRRPSAARQDRDEAAEGVVLRANRLVGPVGFRGLASEGILLMH